MSRDDDDDFTDEDDESDEDEVYDQGDDTGVTGDDHPTTEDTRMSESTDKPNTAKPAAKAPARRAPMGLLGSRPAAQAAKPPQPPAKPAVQAVAPPQPEQAVPPAKADLAKAELGFSEDMFLVFLKSEGTYQPADFAKIKFAGLVEMVQKWVAEAIETNVPPVDGWQAAVRKLGDTADAWARDGKCDELTANKIKTFARFVSQRVEALSAFEEAKPAPAKKTELGVAPPANSPAKVEEKKADEPAKVEPKKPESKPAEQVPAKNPLKERVCGPVDPLPPAKKTTDPNAATEVGTPMPGPSRISTGTNGSGGRTTITPDDQAKLAEVAASIKDEQSVSFQAPAVSGLVNPVHPEARAAMDRQLAELARTNPPTETPRRESGSPEFFRPGVLPHGAGAYPFGAGEDPYPPPDASAPAPAADKETAKEAKKPKSSRITMLEFTLMVLVFVLGAVVYRFVVQGSQPAATSVQAAVTTTATTSPTPTNPAVSNSETCAKVTPALLQKYYGQGDPSAFRFEKKTGVRMDCKGKTIYKNPSTGLFNVQPCDICYSR